METIVKVTNRSAYQGGAAPLLKWRVEFRDNDDSSGWSWNCQAGNEQSQNLTQQGLDDHQGQKFRVNGYENDLQGIKHSDWAIYIPGNTYYFSWQGPSSNCRFSGPE